VRDGRRELVAYYDQTQMGLQGWHVIGQPLTFTDTSTTAASQSNIVISSSTYLAALFSIVQHTSTTINMLKWGEPNELLMKLKELQNESEDSSSEFEVSNNFHLIKIVYRVLIRHCGICVVNPTRQMFVSA
jgi:hypothetical protein